MHKELISNKLYYYFIASVILLSSWTIYYTIDSPNIIFAFIIIIFLLRHSWSHDTFNNVITALLSIVIIRHFLSVEVASDIFIFFRSVINIAFLILILKLSNQDRFHIYQKLLNILIVILGIGLFFHIFNILGHPLMQPFTSFQTDDVSGGRIWDVYYTQSYQIIKGKADVYRFASIFDEPGYLGTILAFILAIEKYNLTIKRNLFLFIVGIFTLSGVFIVLTITYFTINSFYIKKFKVAITTLLIGVVCFAIVYQIFPEFYSEIIDRLIITKGGITDDRANIVSFKQYIGYLQQQDISVLLFGEGRFAELTNYGIFISHASWVTLVMQNGIVFLFYFIGVLLYAAYRLKNFYVLLFIIIFTLSMNHRPGIFNSMYFFLLSCGIYQENKND